MRQNTNEKWLTNKRRKRDSQKKKKMKREGRHENIFLFYFAWLFAKTPPCRSRRNNKNK